MSMRIRARAGVRFALLAACLGLTGTAYAAAGPEQQAATGGSAPDATQRQVIGPVTVAGRTTRHVRRGSFARVRGRLRPALAGRVVKVQVRSGGRWKTVRRARTTRDGRFRAAWRAARAGTFRLRVRLSGERATAAAVSRSLRGRVYVYRPALASWYGPGFYGRRTACGGRMSATRLGVANKSLPCGSRVTLRYRGRSLTVPVIDRGPYVGAREFDLTVATKRRLGFGSTGRVWATR